MRGGGRERHEEAHSSPCASTSTTAERPVSPFSSLDSSASERARGDYGYDDDSNAVGSPTSFSVEASDSQSIAAAWTLTAAAAAPIAILGDALHVSGLDGGWWWERPPAPHPMAQLSTSSSSSSSSSSRTPSLLSLRSSLFSTASDTTAVRLSAVSTTTSTAARAAQSLGHPPSQRSAPASAVGGRHLADAEASLLLSPLSLPERTETLNSNPPPAASCGLASPLLLVPPGSAATTQVLSDDAAPPGGSLGRLSATDSPSSASSTQSLHRAAGQPAQKHVVYTHDGMSPTDLVAGETALTLPLAALDELPPSSCSPASSCSSAIPGVASTASLSALATSLRDTCGCTSLSQLATDLLLDDPYAPRHVRTASLSWTPIPLPTTEPRSRKRVTKATAAHGEAARRSPGNDAAGGASTAAGAAVSAAASAPAPSAAKRRGPRKAQAAGVGKSTARSPTQHEFLIPGDVAQELVGLGGAADPLASLPLAPHGERDDAVTALAQPTAGDLPLSILFSSDADVSASTAEVVSAAPAAADAAAATAAPQASPRRGKEPRGKRVRLPTPPAMPVSVEGVPPADAPATPAADDARVTAAPPASSPSTPRPPPRRRSRLAKTGTTSTAAAAAASAASPLQTWLSAVRVTGTGAAAASFSCLWIELVEGYQAKYGALLRLVLVYWGWLHRAGAESSSGAGTVAQASHTPAPPAQATSAPRGSRRRKTDAGSRTAGGGDEEGTCVEGSGSNGLVVLLCPPATSVEAELRWWTRRAHVEHSYMPPLLAISISQDAAPSPTRSGAAWPSNAAAPAMPPEEQYAVLMGMLAEAFALYRADAARSLAVACSTAGHAALAQHLPMGQVFDGLPAFAEALRSAVGLDTTFTSATATPPAGAVELGSLAAVMVTTAPTETAGNAAARVLYSKSVQSLCFAQLCRWNHLAVALQRQPRRPQLILRRVPVVAWQPSDGPATGGGDAPASRRGGACDGADPARAATKRRRWVVHGLVLPATRSEDTFSNIAVREDRVLASQPPAVAVLPRHRAALLLFGRTLFTPANYATAVNVVDARARAAPRGVADYLSGYSCITTGPLCYAVSATIRRYLQVRMTLTLAPLLAAVNDGAEAHSRATPQSPARGTSSTAAPSTCPAWWATVALLAKAQWRCVVPCLSCTCTPRMYEVAPCATDGTRVCRHLAELYHYFCSQQFSVVGSPALASDRPPHPVPPLLLPPPSPHPRHPPLTATDARLPSPCPARTATRASPVRSQRRPLPPRTRRRGVRRARSSSSSTSSTTTTTTSTSSSSSSSSSSSVTGAILNTVPLAVLYSHSSDGRLSTDGIFGPGDDDDDAVPRDAPVSSAPSTPPRRPARRRVVAPPPTSPPESHAPRWRRPRKRVPGSPAGAVTVDSAAAAPLETASAADAVAQIEAVQYALRLLRERLHIGSAAASAAIGGAALPLTMGEGNEAEHQRAVQLMEQLLLDQLR
ncbi:hypothetical protein NESM_000802000 [Novymonas esmeraldas]|uniref:SWIM-type domain-containing protein n=1 Tax=Novymonas esmeraldas TaxID=1808958 RepID=A0AAW0EVX8_9TRYP